MGERTIFYQEGDQLDPYFEAVGRVTGASVALELAVGLLYAAMLRSPVGRLAASGQSFATVMQACRGIQLETKWTFHDAYFVDVVDRATELYELRNQVVHGVFFEPDDGDESYRVWFHNRRWSLVAGRNEWSIAALRRLASDLILSSGAVRGLIEYEAPR